MQNNAPKWTMQHTHKKKLSTEVIGRGYEQERVMTCLRTKYGEGGRDYRVRSGSTIKRGTPITFLLSCH